MKDQFPLPRVDALLRAVKVSHFFIALDLRSGYWQLPVAAESVNKTAFRTHMGLFEFLRMPFGLVNAPATFQRYMQTLFGDLFYDGILVYLDNILVHASTFDELMLRFSVVLERLLAAGLTLNLEKCAFCPPRLKYLGHFLSEGQMSPKLERVEALKRRKRPTSTKELRSILGFFSYTPTSKILLP